MTYFVSPTQIGKILRVEHDVARELLLNVHPARHHSRKGKITAHLINPILKEMGLQITARPYATCKAFAWQPTEKALDLELCYFENLRLTWDSKRIPEMITQYIKEKKD